MKQDVIRRLNAELACVQAARDENALRACKPKPPAMPDGGNPPHLRPTSRLVRALLKKRNWLWWWQVKDVFAHFAHHVHLTRFAVKLERVAIIATN